MTKIAITIGDVAGIGAEIISKLIDDGTITPEKHLLIGCIRSLKRGDLKDFETYDIPCDFSKIEQGKPSKESGRNAFWAIDKAAHLANSGKISGIVTAPISKFAINMAGYHYSGHTEIFQEKMSGKAEMIFVSNDLRIMILTRHVRYNDVSKILTPHLICEKVRTLRKSLIKNFYLKDPKIAICGLNPHAGEDGLLGNEENNIFVPAIETLKSEGVAIEGPISADYLFSQAGGCYFKGAKQPYDAYIACYHDQGLIPAKLIAYQKAVNVTVGLNVIRTSPCHGVAYDIVGKNKANTESFKNAIELAESFKCCSV